MGEIRCMNKTQERIAIVERGASARGKKELLAHLYGERQAARQAIFAKCYDCACYFADGRVDCEMPLCPLNPFMAYNPNRQKSRIMSEEQKKAIRKRLKNAPISRRDTHSVDSSKRKSKKVSP